MVHRPNRLSDFKRGQRRRCKNEDKIASQSDNDPLFSLFALSPFARPCPPPPQEYGGPRWIGTTRARDTAPVTALRKLNRKPQLLNQPQYQVLASKTRGRILSSRRPSRRLVLPLSFSPSPSPTVFLAVSVPPGPRARRRVLTASCSPPTRSPIS